MGSIADHDRYGINSFVYRARLPFHPARLYELVHDKFVILEPQNDEQGDDGDEDKENGEENEESGPSDNTDNKSRSTNASSSSDAEDIASSPPSSISEHETLVSQFPDIPLDTRLANKKAHPLFKSLLRSKGFIWLATRPKQSGDWSQAGAMLTFSPGMQWFCTLPRSEWPLPSGEAGEDVKKLIEADYEGEWGDRRQEIVLIGEGLDVKGLTELLGGCLLKGDEIVEWRGIMRMDVGDEEREELLREVFEDGWEEWNDPSLMADGEGGHVHGTACSL